MAANAGRYPVSAQCEMPGVARSTCCSMRSRAESLKPPDPIEPDVPAAHEASRGRYGARKIKASPARRGITASRRRICRIMRESGLASAYGRKKPECHPGRSNEADPPNAAAGQFGGREPRTHVRVGGGWSYVCLPADLANREIVGHSAGPRKDAELVRAAFATVEPPFPTSRFSIPIAAANSTTPRSTGCSKPSASSGRSPRSDACDNAVDESTNKILKAEFVYREAFATTRELQAKLSDYVHWYNNFRLHSTLGYMAPVEFRKAGLVLPESSK